LKDDLPSQSLDWRKSLKDPVFPANYLAGKTKSNSNQVTIRKPKQQL